MWTLIRKDLILDRRVAGLNFAMYMVMGPVFVSLMSEPPAWLIAVWAGIVGAMIPLSLVSREDKFNSGPLTCSLPVTRDDVVASRFVGGWMLSLLGAITVMVEPNVSSIVGFRGPNDEIPWTKERKATTQVRVMDGQTFMIAGLLSEDESEGVTKVPFLGDIPILGYLFQHRRMETKNSDLIIKITPRIVS